MELSVSSETTFFNMKLQLEIYPQLRTGSSAEDRGRIDTTVIFGELVPRNVQFFGGWDYLTVQKVIIM